MFHWCHFPPLSSWSQFPYLVPWIPQWLLSHQINLVKLPLPSFWTSMCSWIKVISKPQSTSNTPTSNNTCISLVATFHPPNAPSPSLWPSRGGKSTATLMTSTPQNPFSSEVIPHPHKQTHFLCPPFSWIRSPNPFRTPTLIPLLPCTILTSLKVSFL